MTQVEDPTPFFRRRRNLLTAMVFVELLIMPLFVDHQLFKRYINPVDVSNSFGLAYLVSQFFGGILATIFGGHQLISCAVCCLSITCFLVPYLSAVFTSWIPNIVLGFLQGFIMPSLLVMWSKWLPPTERASSIGVALSGAFFGYIWRYQLQSYYSEQIGRNELTEPYFYIIGILGLLWTFLWMRYIKNSPELDQRITSGEKSFIRDALAGQSTHKFVPIPWISMLTSTAVLAIIAATFVQNWAFITLQVDIPVLYNNTWYQKPPSIAIYISAAISTFVCGFVIDKVQKKFEHISNGKIRRQLICVCFIEQILCIYIAYLFGMDIMQTTNFFKSLGMAFASLAYVRITANYLEIAPQFAGILYGVCNTLANVMVVGRLFAIEYIISCNLGSDETFLKHADYISFVLAAGAGVYWFIGQKDILPWAVQEVVVYQN